MSLRDLLFCALLLALALVISGCFTSFGPDGFYLHGQRYVNVKYGYLGYADLRQDFTFCAYGQAQAKADDCMRERGWLEFKK